MRNCNAHCYGEQVLSASHTTNGTIPHPSRPRTSHLNTEHGSTASLTTPLPPRTTRRASATRLSHLLLLLVRHCVLSSMSAPSLWLSQPRQLHAMFAGSQQSESDGEELDLTQPSSPIDQSALSSSQSSLSPRLSQVSLSSLPSLSQSSASSTLSVLSSSPSSAARKEKRWRWDTESELALVKIVRSSEVWACGHGQVGGAWKRAAEHVNAVNAQRRQAAVDGVATERTCRERYVLLCSKQEKLRKQPERRSGSSEEYGEVEQAVEQCIELTEEFNAQTAEIKKKVAERKQEVEDTQSRVRAHGVQRLSQRRPASQSLSPTSSSSAAAGDESKSDSEQAGGHAKRQKPSLKIQREALDYQKEVGSSLAAQMERLVKSSEKESLESTRGNDLFEQYLARR